MRSPKIILFACLVALVALIALPNQQSPHQHSSAPAQTLAFLQTPAAQHAASKHAISPPPVKASDPCNHMKWLVVIAHPDDDLLFMNPDISRVIARGGCVQTVYVTGGDDGRDPAYVVSREHGVQAAYNVMAGRSAEWSYQTISLPNSPEITTASPKANSRIAHVYLHLPDGNLDGRGFAVANSQSLKKLEDGALNSITAFGAPGDYTSSSLTLTLVELIEQYRPTRIATQSIQDGSHTDHSDHIVTGQLTLSAASIAETLMKRPIKDGVWAYAGYPIRKESGNLDASQAAQKSLIFFAYAHFDPGVCNTLDECEQSASTYTSYLSRQYKTRLSTGAAHQSHR